MMPFHEWLITVEFHYGKSPTASIPLTNTVLESPTMSKSRFSEELNDDGTLVTLPIGPKSLLYIMEF